jgi:hypothetical protein
MKKEPSPEILEICFNLWMVLEKDTGQIFSYLGKAYGLRGTREEKLRILHALSADDHYTVPRRKIPARFEAMLEGEMTSGLTTPEIARKTESGFWVELLETLEKEMPPQLRWLGGTSMEIRIPVSDDPLCVQTLLIEQGNGILIPQVQPIEQHLGKASS